MSNQILLVISAAKQDQYTYSVSAPICRENGEPFTYEYNGTTYPVTAKVAAMFCILGLPMPKTTEDVVNNMAYLTANFGAWNVLQLTADRLYKNGDEYSSNFLIAGWEDWKEDKNGNPYVSNAHLKLDLTALSANVFGHYDELGKHRWLHINSNLGTFDGTLNAQGINTLIEYHKKAVSLGVGQKCAVSKDGLRKFNYEWDSFGTKYVGDDGKERGLFVPTARIAGGSAFYALIEQKASGHWGTVPITLRKADGTPLTHKDGKPVVQQGWGFVNSTLYPWAGCVPSSWGIPTRGPKSSNRKMG